MIEHYDEKRERFVPSPAILIENDGPKLVSTTYWATEQAQRGYMFLSTNAGTIRLLVPPSQEATLPDMLADVHIVVLTRGRFRDQADAIEVMFEDGSNAPFCMHIDQKQMDRRWLPKDEGKRWKFAVYTQAHGEVASFRRCFLRSYPLLPYRAPWRG